ncbi:hypothetical protein HDV02_005941 [Globomyces sp. JEL0801]|nr:hypothetical protein HDV02_005941 [Globomyces sp. JEL0801]
MRNFYCMLHSQQEKADFIDLLLQGKEVKDIHENHLTGIHLSTLHRWAKLAKTNGHLIPKKSSGRPLKIQDRAERHLIRVAKANPQYSIKKLGQVASVSAHHQTIVKVLKRHNLQSFQMMKYSNLNSKKNEDQ